MKFTLITASVLLLLPGSASSWLAAHEIEITVETVPQGLAVRVTYEDGGPAGGAHVTLRPERGETLVAEGTADAGGVWVTPLPAPGAYELTAMHGGHREEVDLEIGAAAGGNLEARVRDHEDHAPATGSHRLLRIVGGGLALLLVGIVARHLLGRRHSRSQGRAEDA